MTAFLKQLESGVRSSSPAQTMAVAEQLGPILPKDITLCLQGPVGSGKTSFTSALAKKLGVQNTVTSPSYNLLSIYKGKQGTILHLDAYRLDKEASGEALVLEDSMISPWLLIVEWPENIPKLLPPNKWWLHFDVTGENDRVIKLERPGKTKSV